MNSKKMLIAGVAILTLGSIGTIKSSNDLTEKKSTWESVYFQKEEDQAKLVSAVCDLEKLQSVPKGIRCKKKAKRFVDYGVPVLGASLIANGLKTGNKTQIIGGIITGGVSALYHFLPKKIKGYNTKITRKGLNKNLKSSMDDYNNKKVEAKNNLDNLVSNLVENPEDKLFEVKPVNVSQQTMLLHLLMNRRIVQKFSGDDKDKKAQDFKGFCTALNKKLDPVKKKLVEEGGYGDKNNVFGYLKTFEKKQKEFIANVLNPLKNKTPEKDDDEKKDEEEGEDDEEDGGDN